MQTQRQLRREYERLLEAEDYAAAGKVLDLLEPVSDEEWVRLLRAAPPDDEGVSPGLRQRLDEAHAALDGLASRQVS